MTSIKYTVLLLFLSFPFLNKVVAQQPQYRHYTVDDGLPSSEVYHAIQDSKGYMWFATDAGVSRFDGYRFRNYTKEDGLPDNVVFRLYEDFKGRIWFIAHNCKLSYFFNNSINTYKYNNLILKIVGNWNITNSSFYIDKKETLYFSPHRLGHIIIEKEGKVKYKRPDSLDKYILKVDSNNFLFCVARDRPDTNKFGQYSNGKYKISPQEFGNSKITSWVQLNKNKFLISTEKNILTFGSAGLQNLKSFNARALWIYRDSQKNIWIGFENGGSDLYFNGDFKSKPVKYLNEEYVSSIMEDRENGFWFTTVGNGIFYAPNPNIFNYDEVDLSGKGINCIDLDLKNNVWIGLNNGEVKRINKAGVTSYKLGKTKIRSFINDNPVIVLGSDLCTYNNGIFDCLNLTKGFISIAKAGKTDFWLGNRTGLHHYSSKSKSLENISFNKNLVFRVYSIFPINHNQLLLGTHVGLWYYEKANNEDQFTFYGDSDQLFREKITKITRSVNGWLSMASSGSGVIIKREDTTFNISTKDGLTSDFCTSLIIKDSVLWIGTNKGLNKVLIPKYNLFKPVIESFSRLSGLISNEINDIAFKGDSIFIATNNGLAFFDTKLVKPNNIPPPVYLEQLSINEKDTSIEESYLLTYDQNFIKISYVGLGYKNAGNLDYKYKLEGVDKNWVSTKSTAVQYPQLQPGDYSFKVIAINEDGYESLKPATVSFSISPPWWATWWLRGSLFLALSSLVWAGFYLRLNALRKRAQLQQAALKAEQQALNAENKAIRAQMNPHFIFNALGSIQQFIMKNNPKEAYNYLSKFSKLMRLILDRSKETFVPLEDEIRSLELYMSLEALRINPPFDYEIDIDPQLRNEDYEIPGMIIQPYIENAIWHGIANKDGQGKIQLSLQLKNNIIECLVEDNGIGRKKAKALKALSGKKHKSVGMQLTKERLALLGKDFQFQFNIKITDPEDSEGKALGTKVSISLPFRV